MGTDLWPTIHAERDALAKDLEGLTDAQWQTQSLCHDWSVRAVVAHLTGSASMTFPKFAANLVRSGFRPTIMLQRLIEANRGDSPADTLARFKAVAHSTGKPFPPTALWLGEVIVHGEDIRGPLGIAHTYPPDALERIAQLYQKANLDGSKKRMKGLAFRATDGDWSLGEGPEVTGPGIALVQAMTGRVVGLDQLSGEGAPTLKERL
jgi:uncharacterized protein (TIGR03083 family)